MKEVEMVEGGLLEFGFTLYRNRFEIIEKDEHSSIIKSIIEYELDDNSTDNVSMISVDTLAAISLLAKNHLTKSTNP